MTENYHILPGVEQPSLKEKCISMLKQPCSLWYSVAWIIYGFCFLLIDIPVLYALDSIATIHGITGSKLGMVIIFVVFNIQITLCLVLTVIGVISVVQWRLK
jgi:hypothetical protein